MVRGVGAIAVALVACGSPDRPHVVGIVDGAFLEARYFEADGAHVFRGWHDTGLDMDCQFQVASDGVYRCLPQGIEVGYTGSEFADASCTLPVVVSSECHVPRYALGPPRPTPLCGDPSGVPVLAVGTRRTSTTYFRLSDGVCTAQQAALDQVVHDLSGRIDADNFIGAELGSLTADALAPYAFRASDGAIEVDSVWDAARAAECIPRGPDDARRCEPLEIALHYDHIWADGLCSVHAAADLSQVRPCGIPTAVIGLPGDDLREIGAAVPVSDVHLTNTPGVCSLYVPELDDSFYLEGAVIPRDRLAAMPEVLDGDGRVRAVRYTDTRGTDLVIATQFQDTLFDAPCYPALFSDGSYRCRPAGNEVSPPRGVGSYADSACMQPVFIIPDLVQPPPAVILIRHSTASTCDAVECDDARAVGPVFDGPLFGGTGCVSLPRNPAYVYYTLGEPVNLPVVRER